MKQPPEVAITVAPINQAICKAFAKGSGGKIVPCHQSGDRIATYGIKRGSGDSIKRAKEFWYIDHGYFGKGSPHRFDGYYRIVYNNIINDTSGDFPSDRLDKFNIKLKDWRKDGDKVIMVPPSLPMGKFLGVPNEIWIQETKKQIQKYTDREIVVCQKEKGKKSNLMQLLDNAWVLITDHSNCQVDALVAGVPVITTSPMRKIGSLAEIESPVMDRSFLKNLAYRQWTIKEIESGQAWRELNDFPQ
jgi:hypothetical protein